MLIFFQGYSGFSQRTKMIDPASFRDPSGFVYHNGDDIFRAVTSNYSEDYDALMNSGLHSHLVEKGYLIPHQEINARDDFERAYYKIIQPEKVVFISYPYEWCFSQLKDAAILTLEIEKLALEFNMTLKDASAYNIQFHKGKPIHIDTLSFERYEEGNPWQAYRQFCEFFLGPLALMSFVDHRLVLLLKEFINGIPLELTYNLLPFKSKFKIGIYLHLILHSKYQQRYTFENKRKQSIRDKKLAKKSLLHLIDNLLRTVKSLNVKNLKTEWNDYYEVGIQSQTYLDHKEIIVSEFFDFVKPTTVCDLGSNDGRFSLLAESKNCTVTSIDSDWRCIEDNYKVIKLKRIQNILPLIIDLTNPSPGIGWDNIERGPIFDHTRTFPCDMMMALAILHHLVISNNILLDQIANFFAKNCRWLTVEFIPKEDEKATYLLENRLDVFSDYSIKGFEKAFSNYFLIEKRIDLNDSIRLLYLMRSKITTT